MGNAVRMLRPDIFGFKPMFPNIDDTQADMQISFTLETEMEVDYLENVQMIDHLMGRDTYSFKLGNTAAAPFTDITLVPDLTTDDWRAGWHPETNRIPVASDKSPSDLRPAQLFTAPVGNDALGFIQRNAFWP